MDPVAAVYAPESRLVASPAASVEIAAAAMDAQDRAGLRSADFVIIALPPGGGSADLVDALTRVARQAPQPAGRPPLRRPPTAVPSSRG